jgi:hypothetical protein
VHLSKYDIKDGYYHMFLHADDCPWLASIMPRYEGEEQLIAIPMVACTMGWVQSPTTFCAMSETIADLANQRSGRSQIEACTPPPRGAGRSARSHPNGSPRGAQRR